MKNELLHVFRNTPFGRETLFHSIYFCKKTATELKIYIPKFKQFLMYFENGVVTVDLDDSYLTDPATAKEHAEKIIRDAGLIPHFIEPKSYTASTLPDLPVDFKYMTCPRSMSDISSKIGLGYIGPKVRNIIKHASFPVLMGTPVYKEWKNIMVFFGGSNNAGKAVRVGIEIGKISGFPMLLFTQAEGKPKSFYEEELDKKGLLQPLKDMGFNWLFFDKGDMKINLYEVPHDSLLIVGAYGHGPIKDMLFGSKLELIQSYLPNNIVIVGPNYEPSFALT